MVQWFRTSQSPRSGDGRKIRPEQLKNRRRDGSKEAQRPRNRSHNPRPPAGAGPNMLKLADIKTGLVLVGIEPSRGDNEAAVVPIGADAVQLFYKTPDGSVRSGY